MPPAAQVKAMKRKEIIKLALYKEITWVQASKKDKANKPHKRHNRSLNDGEHFCLNFRVFREHPLPDSHFRKDFVDQAFGRF